MKHPIPIVQRRMKTGARIIALTLATMAASGCSALYFHSDALEGLAKEARTELQGVFGKNLAGDLSDQIKADQGFALDLIRSLSEISNDTQLNALLSQKWGKLLVTAGERLEGAEKLAKGATKKLETINKNLARQVEILTGAEEHSIIAAHALQEAVCYRERYAETQSLIAGIVGAQFKQADGGGLDAVNDLFKKPFSAPEEVKTGSCKDAGTVGELLGLEAPAEITKAIGDKDRIALVEAIFKNLDTLPKLGEDTKLALRSPGLSATILGLAFDVASAAELRFKAEVDHWRALKRLREAQFAFAGDWEIRLRRTLEVTGSSSNLNALLLNPDLRVPNFGDLTVGDGLRELAVVFLDARRTFLSASPVTDRIRQQHKRARQNLSSALAAAAESYEILFVMEIASSEFETRATTMETARQAVLAEAALKEREAVLSRGFEGLVAFHESGINAEDIRGLIGLAQFAGLLAIAEGN